MQPMFMDQQQDLVEFDSVVDKHVKRVSQLEKSDLNQLSELKKKLGRL